MRRSVLACGLWIAGCGAAAREAPTLSPSNQPPTANVARAPTHAIVAGDWTSERTFGPTTSAAALSVDDGGVALLVTGIDVAPVLATRAVDGAWTTAALAEGRAIAGSLAARTALVVLMDPLAMTVDLVVVEGGRAEALASDCAFSILAASSELLAPDLARYVCGETQVVARRTEAGWQTLATLPAVLATGAADAGTVWIADTNSAPPASLWIIEGTEVRETTVDGVRVVGDLAPCGGRLYATFEQSYDAGALPALGVWTEAGWRLETITDEVAGSGRLALDEACHPFVALGDVVYARGPDGWVPSRLGVVGASIHDLAAHDGQLFLAYDVVTDASHAGLAWAPLGE